MTRMDYKTASRNPLLEISKHLDEILEDMKEINWSARSITDIVNNTNDIDKVIQMVKKITILSEKYTS